MAEDFAAEAKVFKALCNEYRLQVLSRLRLGEKCACDLLEHVDISQSNLSHHMKILVESGIVASRQDGKWTRYSIDPKGSKEALDLMARLVASESPSSCGCKN